MSPVVCYSAIEVAKITGLSLSTIRKQTRIGEIPHIRVGRRILYPVTAIHEWLIANTIGLTAPQKDGEIDG